GANPYTLVVVGTGPASAELTGRVDPWTRDGRVVVLGWQDQQSLYDDIFPSLDCLVHFAHTEGVTIAPREAMANGVVPVISQFIGLKTEGQFVHGVNALTFPVGDTQAAADRVARLLDESGLLNMLSANAADSQKGIYTFAGSMDAWAEAFDRCLEQPPSRGPAPKLAALAGGRLSRLNIPPGLAQRMRDLLGKRYVHADPGSEWPTGSGSVAPEVAAAVLNFAFEWEQRAVPAYSC